MKKQIMLAAIAVAAFMGAMLAPAASAASGGEVMQAYHQTTIQTPAAAQPELATIQTEKTMRQDIGAAWAAGDRSSMSMTSNVMHVAAAGKGGGKKSPVKKPTPSKKKLAMHGPGDGDEAGGDGDSDMRRLRT